MPGRFRPLPTVASVVVSGVLAACSATHHEEVPLVTDTNRISGKILEIQPLAQRLVLADAGRRLAVTWAPGTLVKSGSRELAVSDLRKGDRVVVSLRETGDPEARIITLAGPDREPGPSPTPGDGREESP